MLKENKNIDQSYTDRVVRQLVDETKIDFKNSRVKLESANFSFPFYSFGARRADAENLISEPNGNFGKYVDENVNHLYLHEQIRSKRFIPYFPIHPLT